MGWAAKITEPFKHDGSGGTIVWHIRVWIVNCPGVGDGNGHSNTGAIGDILQQSGTRNAVIDRVRMAEPARRMIIKTHKLRVSGASQAGGGEDNQHSPPKSTRPRTNGVGLSCKGHRHAFWMDKKTLNTNRADFHPFSGAKT